MSLHEPKRIRIVKEQYLYKLMAFSGYFVNLMILQILILLLTMAGGGMSGTSANNLTIYVRFYSGDALFYATLVWAFIVAVLITTRQHRDYSRVFVADHGSHHASDFLFLLTACFAGSVASVFGSVFQKVIVYLYVGGERVIHENFPLSPGDLATGVISALFWFLLFAAAGYLAGSLTQLHRGFAVLLPVVVFALMLLDGNRVFGGSKLERLIGFYAEETSLALFILKAACTSAILYLTAVLATRRVEVRA